MQALGTTVSMLLLALAGSASAAEVTVLTAANIHTMDIAQPRVQALAYDDGRRSSPSATPQRCSSAIRRPRAWTLVRRPSCRA